MPEHTTLRSREKGKIAHSEWDTIASRHRGGESLASIARSYGCTAPAIRYILGRQSGSATSGEAAPDTTSPYVSRDGGAVTSPEAATALPGQGRIAPAQAAFNKEFRARITGDIAVFLEALGTLSDADTVAHREALIDATDRLLRAAARTRIELERLASTPRR
jgi:hypothetical protein